MNRFLMCLLALPLLSCDGGLKSFVTTEILLTPQSLGFSRVRVGASDIQPLEIRAGGDAPLKVTSIRLAPPYEECDRVTHELSPNEPLPARIDSLCEFVIDERPDPLPFELEVDDFRNVNVRYRPTSAETPEGAMLIIESNDLDNPVLEVPLRVQGSTPRIAVRPDTVGFTGGVMGTDHVIVSNNGTGNLNVTRFDLVRTNPPPTDPASGEPITEFFIDADAGLPWLLAERQSVTVEVRYVPADAGDDEATLSFFSDDPEQGQIDVTLTTSAVFGFCEVPSLLEFPGDGASIVRDLQITNSGRAALAVLAVAIEPEDTGYATVGQTSFQIGGSDSKVVKISYNTQSEVDTARAFIQHDGENGRPKSEADLTKGTWVQLVRDANALPPTIGIEPALVNWGDIANGTSRDQAITLTNVGGQPLTITRASLSTAEDVDAGIVPSDPEFSVLSGAIDSATEIGPGDSHDVVVQFARPADDMSSHVGTLVIESDAASSPDQVLFTVGAPIQEE